MPASLLAPLPTRVIDVGPQEGSKPPKLLLTQGGYTYPIAGVHNGILFSILGP